MVHCFGLGENKWKFWDFEQVKTPLILQEYLSGGNLTKYLKFGAFEEDVALFIFKQLFEGIYRIHKSGVFHLDMKPDNILVDGALDVSTKNSRPEGWFKIGDFGLS